MLRGLVLPKHNELFFIRTPNYPYFTCGFDFCSSALEELLFGLPIAPILAIYSQAFYYQLHVPISKQSFGGAQEDFYMSSEELSADTTKSKLGRSFSALIGSISTLQTHMSIFYSYIIHNLQRVKVLITFSSRRRHTLAPSASTGLLKPCFRLFRRQSS